MAYGFFPAPGTNYSVGDEPVIASRLRQLARALRLRLTGISGYRSPAHSVAVGGFANDPHTRGQASDTGGAEAIPEATLERYGLTRPFSGAREANHIQLLRGGHSRQFGGGGFSAPRSMVVTASVYGGPGDKSSGTRGYRGDNLNQHPDSFAELSKNPSGLDFSALGDLPYMAPVTVTDLATGRSTTVYKRDVGAGGSGISGHPRAIDLWYKSAQRIGLQGLGLVRISFAGSSASGSGITRPGGDSGGGPDVTSVLTDWSNAQGGSTDTQFTSFDPLHPLGPLGPGLGLPNPLDLFKNLSGAVNSTTDFLKLLAWIINPLNILRMVEFLVGLVLMGFGFQAMLQAYGEQREGFTTSENPLSRSGLGRVSREVAAAAEVAAVRKAPAKKASKSGGGDSSSKSRVKRPEAAPHRTRRQALRLRYEREKGVSQRRTRERRAA